MNKETVVVFSDQYKSNSLNAVVDTLENVSNIVATLNAASIAEVQFSIRLEVVPSGKKFEKTGDPKKGLEQLIAMMNYEPNERIYEDLADADGLAVELEADEYGADEDGLAPEIE